MGVCSCCPFGRVRRPSKDSLSVDTQHPSVEVELPPPIPQGTKTKKFNNKQIKMLKKQESVFFQQAAHLQLDTDGLDSKVIPLIAPKHQNNQQQILQNSFHAPTPEPLSSVKNKFKPKMQLQKTSTMDEETSQENHFNREQFSESEPEDSFAEHPPKEEEEKANMTFSGKHEAIALGRQFRTNQGTSSSGAAKEEIAKMEERLQHEEAAEQRCELFCNLAKLHCELENYALSQQHLRSAEQLLKEVESAALKFETFSCLGCVLLLQENPTEAIAPLLKAIRLQVAREGADSLRLVEPYYWLGEAYLRTRKSSLAKEYLLKALRGYNAHALKTPSLLQNIHLQLGQLLHEEEELPEADKHYAKGVRAAEESGDAGCYLQLLTNRAQNYMAMESYRLAVSTFANAFRTMRSHNLTALPIHAEVTEALTAALKTIIDACISENELMNVIKSAAQCIHDATEVLLLRERLKRMRAILYRQ